MKLSEKLAKALMDDKTRMLFAIEVGVSYATIRRWIYEDHSKFATLKNIAALEKITALRQDEMFEMEETENA